MGIVLILLSKQWQDSSEAQVRDKPVSIYVHYNQDLWQTTPAAQKDWEDSGFSRWMEGSFSQFLWACEEAVANASVWTSYTQI